MKFVMPFRSSATQNFSVFIKQSLLVVDPVNFDQLWITEMLYAFISRLDFNDTISGDATYPNDEEPPSPEYEETEEAKEESKEEEQQELSLAAQMAMGFGMMILSSLPPEQRLAAFQRMKDRATNAKGQHEYGEKVARIKDARRIEREVEERDRMEAQRILLEAETRIRNNAFQSRVSRDIQRKFDSDIARETLPFPEYQKVQKQAVPKILRADSPSHRPTELPITIPAKQIREIAAESEDRNDDSFFTLLDAAENGPKAEFSDPFHEISENGKEKDRWEDAAVRQSERLKRRKIRVNVANEAMSQRISKYGGDTVMLKRDIVQLKEAKMTADRQRVVSMMKEQRNSNSLMRAALSQQQALGTGDFEPPRLITNYKELKQQRKKEQEIIRRTSFVQETAEARDGEKREKRASRIKQIVKPKTTKRASKRTVRKPFSIGKVPNRKVM
eukprot:TRINITY_DN7632_c0_g1_i1.p1 TRINITY_DN7632_c0_g1~~TRINITY_DN7632_c0_g1_i1.p1  ORF type:complete len:446 (+),score=101.18 TRINITY_DN7632_c0_g1_i1:141-1478(+)